MTQKNKVQLKICGANYTIVSEDEPEYVESLGELLDAALCRFPDKKAIS